MFYKIPKSPRVCEIWSAFFSMRRLYSSQFFSFQISMRSETPANTTRDFKSAKSLRKSGISMRPAPSTSASTAPERKKRLIPRVSAPPIGSFCNLLAISFHAESGYINRHESRPRVITTFFPTSLRNFAGSERRFLESSVCRYSPISI